MCSVQDNIMWLQTLNHLGKKRFLSAIIDGENKYSNDTIPTQEHGNDQQPGGESNAESDTFSEVDEDDTSSYIVDIYCT